MLKPDEAARMVRLRELGWETRRIARECGCGRNTVRRYLEAGGSTPHGRTRRAGRLAGLDDWLRERFHRHRGNAEVVRQELLEELGIETRACARWRGCRETSARPLVSRSTARVAFDLAQSVHAVDIRQHGPVRRRDVRRAVARPLARDGGTGNCGPEAPG